ncbi:MAG TPA: methylmalonyl-CoA mutase, partial [Planctomycetaceae bacterium]|nr:methylmalonyl-CoA mutase [Planctomycetaceae bacterium]
GGSYFVESLTDTLIHEARDYFDRIEHLGGMLAAIETGFFRREISEAAFAYQREVDAGRKLIVGVNAFQAPEEKPIELLQVDPEVERRQIEALAQIKAERDQEAVRRTLDQVRRAAESGENLMPPLMDAARARATVGECMNAMADVFGRYTPVV